MNENTFFWDSLVRGIPMLRLSAALLLLLPAGTTIDHWCGHIRLLCTSSQLLTHFTCCVMTCHVHVCPKRNRECGKEQVDSMCMFMCVRINVCLSICVHVCCGLMYVCMYVNMCHASSRTFMKMQQVSLHGSELSERQRAEIAHACIPPSISYSSHL